MPASVIEPTSRPEVVHSMLIGVPLPPGFEEETLLRGDAVRDRYRLAAQVAGAVACRWIEDWVSARRAGDEVSARKAAQAMASSHTWPVLKEMQVEGDYPEVLWEYADAMASNAPVQAGTALTVASSYAAALGC